MNREKVAGGLLAVALLLGSAELLVAQTSTRTGVRNVVLVHGGFVDGSGWEPVYNALKKDGYTRQPSSRTRRSRSPTTSP